jgi:hypothetical protein
MEKLVKEKKIKVRKIPLTMVIALPALLIYFLVEAIVHKEDAILWNKMVDAGIKCDCTCECDCDESDDNDDDDEDDEDTNVVIVADVDTN